MTISKLTTSLNHLLFIGAGLIALLMALVMTSYASAQEQPSRGLTLSPLRTEIDLAPGTSEQRSLTLTNGTDAAMTVSMTTEEFSVINPQYDYAFNVETDVLSWVSFSESTVVLSAGETKQITFTVGVPIDAEPGGRYLSMFATTSTDTDQSSVVSRQRIGSLIYVTVLGDITRLGGLVSLGAPWVMTGPVDWRVTLQNTGTTHYRSRYNVVVQDLFGNNTVTEKAGEALILPGTVRLITDSLPLPTYPGVYKVVYTIGLGDTPAKVESRYVLYIPTAAIIVIAFAAILAFALIGEFRTRKKLKG